MLERQNLETNATYVAFYAEAVPHLDALFATALRLTKNGNDAEDLVQETMLKAFRYFDKYEQGTNCKAWLFKIMTNTFINRYRKQQKRREFLIDEEEGRSIDERAQAPERNPYVDHIELEDDSTSSSLATRSRPPSRACPWTSAWSSCWPISRTSPTKRSPRSWSVPLAPS